MFEQVGSDQSERDPLRLRILKPLIVAAIVAVLFGGLFAATQLLD